MSFDLNGDICAIIAQANTHDVSHCSVPRTELDSHANMFVAGCHVHILASTGKTASVKSFSPDIPAKEIPIIDCAIMYDCPYTGIQAILVATDALHVPSMDHNLVPPFMLREAGIIVNEQPKCQSDEPTSETHSLYFPDEKIRIPMSLNGIFSYFPSRKPTVAELQIEELPVVRLTPQGTWHPYNVAHALNEESMVDSEGNLSQPSRHTKLLLDDIPIDDAIISSLEVSSAHQQRIDAIASYTTSSSGIPCIASLDSSWNLADVNQVLVPQLLAAALVQQEKLSSYASAVGSTTVHQSHILFPETLDDTQDLDESEVDDYMISNATAIATQGIQANHLSKIWKIDLPTAQKTLQVTNQRCVRAVGPSVSRNYSTNDRMLRYRRIDQLLFMDTFFATKQANRSTRGNTCMQLFVTDKSFLYVVPLRSKSEVPKAIRAFTKHVGAATTLVCDPGREQVSQEVKSFCSKVGTTLRILEKGTQWANRAELYIGLFKESIRKDMKASDCPLVLWDYCAERRARIHNLTASPLFQLQGRNPHHTIYGEEGDISNLAQFDWYQWVYYREASELFPFPREILGRTLGPATGEGNEMAQWILKANGKVIPRRTIRPLINDEMKSQTEIDKRNAFTKCILSQLGSSISPPVKSEIPETYTAYEDDDEEPFAIPEVDDPIDSAGKAFDQQPLYDRLINAELMLPKAGDGFQSAKVVGRSVGADGKIHGKFDENPLLNTIGYDVEFHDGEILQYSANVIAQNLLSQVDGEGYTLTRLDSITDHLQTPDSVPLCDKYATNHLGVKRIRKTTKGWKLKVKWHDGTEQWIPLSVLKESNPVEVAEYATAAKIANQAAFAWWVPYTLRKRERIISAIKARTRKITHKFGIAIPRDVAHAHQLDKINGNTYWADALSREMTNVGQAFEILDNQSSAPPGWSKVSGHLIFDVKMSLERKARWVLDGHLTDDVSYSTYAGVVSRESIRIALTYAALNNLDVWSADIKNAYIQAPSSRKDYVVCGPEFGLENVGSIALIKRAVCGGKTSGRDFRNYLRRCMDDLKFVSCKADPDVWMRPAEKRDGSKCWEYVLLYTDDILCISENGEDVIRNEIGGYFDFKKKSIGPPDIYLGGKLRKVQLENGLYAWAFGSSQYIQEVIANLEKQLSLSNNSLPRNVMTPISSGYRPEIDVTPELSPKEATEYQSHIGVLRWIVELGRIDICCEVSMLLSHLALPRCGHLQQVYRIFAYLKSHHNSELVFDPEVPDVDESLFQRQDWSTSEMSHELNEELPSGMPEPRGIGFLMTAYVDADHATDSMTRKSRTGFIVYLNSSPIYWMSKKQTSVETSSFGSEFVAMKLCTEYVRGLRYKLRMMGIPCEGPTLIYGDNKSVLCNTTIPESTLKKKSHSIAYHFIRQGVARDEWRTAYVNTHLNPADLLTKPLPSGEKRKSFIRMLLHHIF